MIENYNGYLPLKKLLDELKKHKSIKDGLLYFKKYQNCLINGQANIRKLRRFFKNSDFLNSNILNSNINHIFVLDNHALLIFTNDKDSPSNTKRIFYVYNNEFKIEIYTPYRYNQLYLNTTQLYYAYDFLNKKIDLIIDYFSNIYLSNLNLKNDIDNKNLRNIVHYNTKKFISAHSEQPYSQINYINLLTEYFQELNEFTLKNYFLNNIETDVYLANNSSNRITLSIKIKNGAYSVTLECANNSNYRYRCLDLASITRNYEMLTYFPTKNHDTIKDLNDDYAFLKEIFETYDVKNKIHIELERIARELNLNKYQKQLLTENIQ